MDVDVPRLFTEIVSKKHSQNSACERARVGAVELTRQFRVYTYELHAIRGPSAPDPRLREARVRGARISRGERQPHLRGRRHRARHALPVLREQARGAHRDPARDARPRAGADGEQMRAQTAYPPPETVARDQRDRGLARKPAARAARRSCSTTATRCASCCARRSGSTSTVETAARRDRRRADRDRRARPRARARPRLHPRRSMRARSRRWSSAASRSSASRRCAAMRRSISMCSHARRPAARDRNVLGSAETRM